MAVVPDITLDADSTLRTVSAAGAAAQATPSAGLGAFGAALDLGTLGNAAYAYIGDNATVTTRQLEVRADTHEDILSVVAAMSELADGPANQLYRNNGTSAPFSGVDGDDIGGGEIITSDVALGDIDNDGDLDLVTGSFGQFNRRYLNDGSGNFSDGRDIGGLFDLASNAVSDLLNADVPDIDPKALIPDLTLDIELADVDGDGDLDVIAGNLYPGNRLYKNRGDGTFDLAVDIGARTAEFSIGPDDVANNVTIADLVTDLQAKVDAAVGVPGIVRVVLTPEGAIDLVCDTLTMTGDDKVEQQIAQARRDGFLVTADGNPLAFTLVVDGAQVPVSIHPLVTNDNITVEDLRRDLQQTVNDALVLAGKPAGAVSVQFDANGVIVFVAAGGHTLEDPTAAQNAVHQARRDGRLKFNAANDPLEFSINLSENDPTTSVAVADLDGDNDLDVVAGNLGQPSRFYLNRDGSGTFEVGQLVSPNKDFTTAVKLADLNGDGRPDLIAGNVGFDLAALIEDGLVRVTDFVEGVVVDITKLVEKSLVKLIDLVEQALIDRFDFDPLAPIKVGDLLANKIADLMDLVFHGLVGLDDFVPLTFLSQTLINSGLVTQEELDASGIVDALGRVKLKDLIESGLVALEELVGVQLLKVSDLNISDISLGELLDTPLADIRKMIEDHLVDLPQLITQTINLRELIKSGIVKLADLAQKGLLGLLDLDQRQVDFQNLLNRAAFGGPTRIYINGFHDGVGGFGPAAELSGDRVITTSLAVGDVDEDGDLDVVVGSAEAGARLYLNNGFNNGAVGFTFATTISDVARLTSDVLLEDMNGDGHLDLVTANLGFTNRVYLGDGAGHFGPGADISADAHFTSSVAAGDVDGDGARDVIAGDSSFAAAGSASYFDVAVNGKAYIGAGAKVTTDSSVFVHIEDDADVVALAGSDVSSNTPAIGLSLASPNIVRRMEAYVQGEVRPAQGSGLAAPQGLFISAIANDDLLTYAVGSGTSGELGVAASASAPRMDSQIDAYIAQGASITVRNPATNQPLGVTVRAEHFTDSLGVAGSFAGSLQQGFGAAADLKVFNKRVHAHIDPGATVSVQNDVVVEAVSHEHPDAIVAGLGVGLHVGLAGSVAYTELNKETFAFIDGATVLADGNVLVRADSFTRFDPRTGATAVGLTAGVGVSGSLLMKADDTRAYITGGAVVDALARGDAIQVYTGEKVGDDRETKAVKGVAVSATNLDETDPVASGGAVSDLLAVAGSGAGVILDNHVAAYVDAGAQVNEHDAGASAEQTVYVFAWDDTEVQGEEGAVTSALLAAASATFHYAKLGKNTEAYIGENVRVDSNTDVEILAHSTEDVRAIGGSSAIGLALVSGTFVGALQSTAAETRASTRKGSRVRAAGKVKVAADNDSQIEVIAAFQTATFPSLISAQVLFAESEIGGKTEATVDGRVESAKLSVTAEADNDATTVAALNGQPLTLLDVNVILPTAKTTLVAGAYLGSNSDVAVGADPRRRVRQQRVVHRSEPRHRAPVLLAAEPDVRRGWGDSGGRPRGGQGERPDPRREGPCRQYGHGPHHSRQLVRHRGQRGQADGEDHASRRILHRPGRFQRSQSRPGRFQRHQSRSVGQHQGGEPHRRPRHRPQPGHGLRRSHLRRLHPGERLAADRRRRRVHPGARRGRLHHEPGGGGRRRFHQYRHRPGRRLHQGGGRRRHRRRLHQDLDRDPGLRQRPVQPEHHQRRPHAGRGIAQQCRVRYRRARPGNDRRQRGHAVGRRRGRHAGVRGRGRDDHQRRRPARRRRRHQHGDGHHHLPRRGQHHGRRRPAQGEDVAPGRDLPRRGRQRHPPRRHRAGQHRRGRRAHRPVSHLAQHRPRDGISPGPG